MSSALLFYVIFDGSAHAGIESGNQTGGACRSAQKEENADDPEDLYKMPFSFWIGCNRLFRSEHFGTTTSRGKSRRAQGHRLLFYTNTRCSTCMKIEAYSHEAIEKAFRMN